MLNYQEHVSVKNITMHIHRCWCYNQSIN